MYIVTGGAGFIGSAFVHKLNTQGIEDILIVDHLGSSLKWKNLVGLRYTDYRDKEEFIHALRQNKLNFQPKTVFHFGACSSTTEADAGYLMDNNFGFSRDLALWTISRNARLVYASSAATYGDGLLSFCDDPGNFDKLRPLNMYGYTKLLFDQWVRQNHLTREALGLRFFNVFGPNEYHKGDMASVIYKAFWQVRSSGNLNLFRSYRTDYGDGQQKRDFIYIKDVVDITWMLSQNSEASGVYNVGTGTARSWNDLANAIFSALGMNPRITYIDMPDNIRAAYQYFTQADTSRLSATCSGFQCSSLEDAVADYINNYLSHEVSYISQ